jgi:hypothetical protein
VSLHFLKFLQITMSSNLRDELTKFCQVELDLEEAASSYKITCAPCADARTRHHSEITHLMEKEGHPWCRLPTGGYLRSHTIKTQSTLKPDLVTFAVTKAIRSLREDPGTNLKEARARLLEFLQKEVRDARSTTNVSVKYVDKLPRSLDEESVPPANPSICTAAHEWMDAKAKLKRIREDHLKVTEELQKVRENVLANTEVTQYLRGLDGGGQQVTLAGKKGKFKLRHSVSTRRKPMREVHVQDALRHAVETTLVDENSSLSSEDMTDLIMKEAIRLAGTETKDVFSLTSQRGRKRAADDE